MFNFRLKFYLLSEVSLDINNELNEVVFNSQNVSYKYIVKNINSNKYVITGKGFESKDIAQHYAQIVRSAIQLYGFAKKSGINFGKEYPTWFFNTKFFEENNENIRVLNDHDGILIYDDEKETHFISNESEVKFSSSIKPMVDTILKYTNENIEQPFRINLAIELYNSYYFQKSFMIKFLILVMTVESLSKQKEREGESLALVCSFIEQLKESQISNNEKRSLRGSLQSLREESISKSCNDIIELYLSDKTYCEMEAVKFFKYCYSVRGSIVHKGIPMKLKYRLDKLTNELHNLVYDLLQNVIKVT